MRNLGWGIWESFVLILKILGASEIISKLKIENGKRRGNENKEKKKEEEKKRGEGR